MDAEQLLAFLRARLDDDEQAARAASEPEAWMELNRVSRPRWYVQYWADPDQAAVIADPESSAYPVVTTPQGMDEADADARVTHIARHDPARVLADVVAKRAVVELHGIVHRNIGWLDDGEEESSEIPVCGHCVPKHSHYQRREDVPEGPCRTLRLLAAVHQDHPDYREEWRP